MIVRNLSEEKMMGDVPISDVMHQLIDEPSIWTIDSLKRSLHEVPSSIFVHANIISLVLEISDHNNPKSLEDKRKHVELDISFERTNVQPGHIGEEEAAEIRYNALDSLGIIGKHGGERPEMTSIGYSGSCVCVPLEEVSSKVVDQSFLSGGVAFESLLCDPSVSSVLLNVTGESMMKSMTFLPRPERTEEKSMSEISNQVVDPYFIRERSVSTIVPNYEN